jgi:hypothetical protein
MMPKAGSASFSGFRRRQLSQRHRPRFVLDPGAGWQPSLSPIGASDILAVASIYSEISLSSSGLNAFFLVIQDNIPFFSSKSGVEVLASASIAGLSGANRGPGVELYVAPHYHGHRALVVTRAYGNRTFRKAGGRRPDLKPDPTQPGRGNGAIIPVRPMATSAAS